MEYWIGDHPEVVQGKEYIRGSQLGRLKRIKIIENLVPSN